MEHLWILEIILCPFIEVHTNGGLNFRANKWESICVSIWWGTEQKPIYVNEFYSCFKNIGEKRLSNEINIGRSCCKLISVLSNWLNSNLYLCIQTFSVAWTKFSLLLYFEKLIPKIEKKKKKKEQNIFWR